MAANNELGERIAEAARAAVSAHLEAAPSLKSLAEVLREVISFEHLSVAIEGDRCRQLFSTDPPHAQPQAAEHPLTGTPFEVAASTGDPVVIEGARAAPQFDEFPLHPEVNSYIALPLAHEGEVVAVISVGFAEPEIPTPKVMQLLSAVGVAVAQAVRNILEFERQKHTIRKLEELDRAKTDFLGMVAHDMRSPTAVIAGYAEALHSRWDDLDEAEKVRLVGTVRRAAQNLRLFIDNALQLAQLESGQFSYEIKPLDLGAPAGSVIETVAGDRLDRVTLTHEESLPLALGDERRNWQILANLLSNALKFSPKDEAVEIEIARDQGMLRVSVRDRGPGLSDDDISRLFHKFGRLENGRSHEGTGLGLYMCKQMVEAQGGSIWVESSPGEGATFSYTLPIA
ncbi:MAG: sensor histidine kinase [Actinomycetota bacterium]